MTDILTPAKGLTQQTIGGNNNTWGTTLNNTLGLIDSALGGTLTKSISGNTTLSSTEIQNTGFHFTGTLSGTATITFPNFHGQAVIHNDTTGDFPIICGISGGDSVRVFYGETVTIWSDGTNFASVAPFSKEEVHVSDFLSHLSGGDYAPVYQAAIDFAFANGIQRVVGLPYSADIYSPIYLDPLGNLRTNPTNPTMFGWTIELIGCGANLGGVGGGTTIVSRFNDQPAIWLGPGALCTIERITVRDNTSWGPHGPWAYNDVNHAYAGIAISGGNAGSQKATIRECFIAGYYSGISVAQNNDSFGEVNRIDGNLIDGCFIGYNVVSNDNAVVHALIGNTINADICVSAPTGAQVNVNGGEYGGNGTRSQKAAVSGVSTLTHNGAYDYTFTATIASPKTYWGGNSFNVANIILPHFGLVPLLIVDFDSVTNIATFQIYPNWLSTFFASLSNNFDTVTDFNAELQAATEIYACYMFTVFQGPIKVRGWRTENTQACCMLDTQVRTSNRAWAELCDGFSNADITMSAYSLPGNDDYANFLAQQSRGFIKQGCNILLENNDFGNTPPDGRYMPGFLDTVVFEVNTNSGHFISRGNNIFNPNMLGGNGLASSPLDSQFQAGYAPTDYGEFDVSPWRPRGVTGVDLTLAVGNNYSLRAIGSKSTRYHGLKAEGGIARITTRDVDALFGVVSLDNPQPVGPDGDPTQQLQDHHVAVVSQGGPQRYALAKRAGSYFSYGVPLDVTGNYKGQTSFINLTGGAHKNWIFPGLEIRIGGWSYLVTGVWYSLGYISVMRFGTYPYTPNPVLIGDKATEYMLTQIDQSPIVMQKFGRQAEFVTTDLAELGGGSFRRGDIVWKINAAATESPGWMCISTGYGPVFQGVLGSASITASIVGTTLTVTAITPPGVLYPGDGSVFWGQDITGSGVTLTTLIHQLTGTPGGVGDYEIDVPQTVSSRAMTATGMSFAPLPDLGSSVTP